MKKLSTFLMAALLPLLVYAEKIEFTAYNLSVRDMNPMKTKIYIKANTDSLYVNLCLNSDKILGTFSESDLYLSESSIETNEYYWEISKANFTVEEYNDFYKVTGTLIDDEDNEYVLDITNTPQGPSRREEAFDHDAVLTIHDGYFKITAMSEDSAKEVQFTLYVDGEVGKDGYCTEDFNSMSMMIEMGESMEMYELIEGDLASEIVNDKYIFEGTLMFQNYVDTNDRPEYIVSFACPVPDPTNVKPISQEEIQEFRLNSHITIKEGKKFLE